ncbi:MAG TPA: RNA polymerase-associated protein RapA [Gammaproteobacteria bacterium]|nr:RNA polymerase-associated protein RapA [Gammaproteobacteria bacterium]
MSEFIAGQRWICDTELELGLGTVVDSDFRTVKIQFKASGETRTYAKQSAPLRRVSFSVGDTIESLNGTQLTIENIVESDGLLRYEGKNENNQASTLDESQLNHNVQLNTPIDRLFSGQIDENKWFQLRLESLVHRQALKNSPLTGIYDARTSLVPHQLYIAHEVAKRFAPRVLLADEVGLGKTIEACLIMQHQLITGRARRVLIVVPDALLHQWLVELMRRFNLRFSVFDNERCEAIEASSAFENPFESEQLVLCTLSFITDNPHRLQQAVNGLWDLVIVDEAHHLHWHEETPSNAYLAIEQLSKHAKGLLLLTATPEQLGKASHFARLRLLDPQRFHDYQSFLDEENHYQSLASAIDAILDDKTLDAQAISALIQWFDSQENDRLSRQLRQPNTLSKTEKQNLINLLLDRHGTGRVLFRNSRKTIKGFPSRQLQTYPLALPKEYAEIYKLAKSVELNSPALNLIPERLFSITNKLRSASNSKLGKKDWWQFDPRVSFLIDFLNTNKNEKVLVICASGETAKDLEKAIRNRSGNRVASFHEDLSIIERDRAASYFADNDGGAQALICSEIGSEGRNFQFSHKLVLFDLPLNPDLLEQRIGRLDRIGQTKEIKLHVPYFTHSPQETLLQWYHQGLNAFLKTCQTGAAIFAKVEPTLVSMLQNSEVNPEDVQSLITNTQKRALEYNQALENGRDRLLELNSCKSEVAETLKTRISEIDKNITLKTFMTNIFDIYGVDLEDHNQNSLFIKPGPRIQSSIFQGLPEDGMLITFDRDTALANENMQFISWNHPYVNDAIDLLLSSENGNTSLVALKTRKFSPGNLIIETVFVPEIIFPEANNAGISVDQQHMHLIFDSQARQLDNNAIAGEITQVDAETAATIVKTQQHILKPALTQATRVAETLLPNIIQKNQNQLAQKIQAELDRLSSLQKINPTIRDEEIQHYQTLLDLSHERLAAGKIRLDAIRISVTH